MLPGIYVYLHDYLMAVALVPWQSSLTLSNPRRRQFGRKPIYMQARPCILDRQVRQPDSNMLEDASKQIHGNYTTMQASFHIWQTSKERSRTAPRLGRTRPRASPPNTD
jgi:hypothetical protein